MKKIILLMLMLSPFAKADMDNICSINLDTLGATYVTVTKEIKKRGCERNNILQVTYPWELSAPKLNEYTEESLLLISGKFCRFDRNMDIKRSTLICVLYSAKPREDLLLEE